MNIDPIKQILRQDSIMVLDGALATELEAHGCDLDDPLWSAKVLLEKPEAIESVHKEYFKAGADCAITASYQATLPGFAERGFSKEQAISLIKKTVELARSARDEYWEETDAVNKVKPLVAASIGPYGAYLADGSEYIGNYGVTDQQLIDFHRPRMKAVVEAGADLLAMETIPSFQEGRVLASLLKEFPKSFAWMSFTLRDGGKISDGTDLQTCVKELDDHGQIAAVGVNCAPMEIAADAVALLKEHTDKPVLIYPNSGETYDPDSNTWHGEGSAVCFDDASERWIDKGASIVGGCCRTTPDHIRRLAEKWKCKG
ncbi:homocysteine S-methyltransferase [Halobacillus litoralis]|uniref:S-methylmethionine:homocysteine methyltransferase n=1 Tax=Halobacillus litoralis TaxID=45668 RepID=A0A845FBZ0_9BACI|nr:homocysteine S-methyltransferase [Halobacillus litoralis]MYL71389.1 homocysteine S-methyltransferase [Halobacillus litoralis]